MVVPQLMRCEYWYTYVAERRAGCAAIIASVALRVGHRKSPSVSGKAAKVRKSAGAGVGGG